MTNQEPNCPTCRVAMEAGITLDRDHGGALRQSQWLEGAPAKSFWTGLKTKDRAMIAIVTYRCPRCGVLASFASEKSGTGSP